MKILGIGNALTDLLAVLPSDKDLRTADLLKGGMELIDEDKLAELTALLKPFETVLTAGGSAANTVTGLARLGISCGFIGKIGHDKYGTLYRKELTRNGVTPLLLRGDKPSGCAVTIITPDGERSFGTYLGAAATFTADELDGEKFAGYDLLHIEGYLVQNPALIVKAVRLAKEKTMRVSLDLSSYNVVKNHLPLFHELLAYTDIVFGNEKEMAAYTNRSPEEGARQLAEPDKIVVLKQGAKGSFVCRGKEAYPIGIQPGRRRDTTGAGDLYAAGFLYGISEKYPLDTCGKIGALLAAGVIENIGPRMSDEQWNKIKLKVRSLSPS